MTSFKITVNGVPVVDTSAPVRIDPADQSTWPAMAIGTGPSCSWRIEGDPYADPMHAVLIPLGGARFAIDDAGSRYGTWLRVVDGVDWLPVRRRTPLAVGYDLQFGRTVVAAVQLVHRYAQMILDIETAARRAAGQ